VERQTAITELSRRGWKVNERAAIRDLLPPELAIRYSRLPESLAEFLSAFSLFANADETTWFLTADDYHGDSGNAFRWNEWEHLSLDASQGDNEGIADIRSFWDRHFPFMLSVQSGYAFHAVRLEDHCFGQVVEGREPEFEITRLVADSFDAFLETLARDNVDQPRISGSL
jgi:hypothetical protein